MPPPPIRATDLDRRMIGFALAILEDAFAKTCGGPLKGTAGLRLELNVLALCGGSIPEGDCAAGAGNRQGVQSIGTGRLAD